MITQDDIDAMASPPVRMTKVNVQVMQWAVRNAYEEGYRAAGGDRGASDMNPEKGKWFDLWVNSRARKLLIQNGIISGMEDFR